MRRSLQAYTTHETVQASHHFAYQQKIKWKFLNIQEIETFLTSDFVVDFCIWILIAKGIF